MDKRMYHKPRFRRTELAPLTAEQAMYETSSNYTLQTPEVESTINVVVTNSRVDIYKLTDSVYLKNWLVDNNIVCYIVAKHVATKHQVYSLIACYGDNILTVGKKYKLKNGITKSTVCEATVVEKITANDYKNLNLMTPITKKITLMLY